jgi:hypothetical protein
MNAVEIEEAISALAEQPFDAAEFPFAFLQAFGNKETTLKRLRKGESNRSDLGGVLQTNNIHIAIAAAGEVTKTLAALRASPATARAKAKFALATDGDTFEAEDLASGETVACAYADFPNHFGFFLPLAGITTIKQISENAFDIRATSRLNRLYVELLKDNPEWGTAARRHDMNHFMARLIFCFFAEDTDIFNGTGLFTATIEQMSARDSSNTHEVVGALFRAMNTPFKDRTGANLRPWAGVFPYVNGGLFSGSLDVPRFSRIARSYLLHIGGLDWTKINPDIFGSMIQAVADDEERGALGLHYTSVPNILKVLNPLFLDDLRARLEEAGNNSRMLLNLRRRMARIRVFDPACGSGNFLVIAYKEMRAIEAKINKLRGEADRWSDIPLTNFFGIELRDFPAEIARLALIIAEFQCDVLYRGQKDALAEFLPLNAENRITCGNALRLDWLSICPPTGTGAKHHADDLFHTPLDQAQIDFENEGGETYICGNPPYRGGTEQTKEQKADMAAIFSDLTTSWKSLDYVCGWFEKFRQYSQLCDASAAFVATNSVSQGEQVARLWPLLLNQGIRINFAYTSFKWSNLAAYNAGVTVVIIGLSKKRVDEPKIFELNNNRETTGRVVKNINPYLVAYDDVFVTPSTDPIAGVPSMTNGSKPVDGGHLFMSASEARAWLASCPSATRFIRPFFGSEEFIQGRTRFCLWINDDERPIAETIPKVSERLNQISKMREKSEKPLTRRGAATPHRFQQVRQTGEETVIIVPSHSSEAREYLPTGLLPPNSIINNSAYAFLSAPMWNMALVASRLHLVWIATVCGKLKTDFRYFSTLGWNTFPVPTLTEKNKADLTRCAEDILLAREAHFPATIADLYDPDNMPADLREAHERNNEVLERIYMGRRFRNDTERLEKLFEFYTAMSTDKKSPRNRTGLKTAT